MDELPAVTELRLAAGSAGHLLLEDQAGARYRLVLDAAVRAAISPPAATGTSALSPRQIQDRLRAGATVDQVAAEAGTSADRIGRWEGPVLAERAQAVDRARATRFARPPDGAVSGPLGRLVDARLAAAGVTGDWDAWKDPDGAWTVQVSHAAGTARWRWSTDGLRALDPAAEQLGWAIAAAAPLTERAAGPGSRRGRLPSWEAILEGTPPPTAFPT